MEESLSQIATDDITGYYNTPGEASASLQAQLRLNPSHQERRQEIWT